MNKILVFILILYNLSSCNITGHKNAVGELRNTLSKTNPFAYENGYSEVKIISPKIAHQNLPVHTPSNHQLIFKDTYYVGVLSNYMYNVYGKWDTIIVIDGRKKPMLMWRNVELFKDSNKKYNVGSYGVVDDKNRYATIIINDQSFNDCLKENAQERDILKNYFTEAIMKTKMTKDFHDAFSDMMEKLYAE